MFCSIAVVLYPVGSCASFLRRKDLITNDMGSLMKKLFNRKHFINVESDCPWSFSQAFDQEHFKQKTRLNSVKTQRRQYSNLLQHWTYVFLRYLNNKEDRSQNLHFVSVDPVFVFVCGTITRTNYKQAKITWIVQTVVCYWLTMCFIRHHI